MRREAFYWGKGEKLFLLIDAQLVDSYIQLFSGG